MARYYLPAQVAPMAETKEGWKGGGMASGPDPDQPKRVPIPPMFSSRPTMQNPGAALRTHWDLKPGGIVVSFVGHGAHHVGPGESIDLSDEIPTAVVLAHAPQLLTKEQAIERGIANEDGSIVRAVAPVNVPTAPAKAPTQATR